MHFLSGLYSSVFEEKYFLPVSKNTGFQSWLVKPDSLLHIRMLESVLHCVELHRDEPPGYEFDLRTELCSFWRGMLADSAEVRAATPPRANADNERIKAMMDFIHTHCAERLTLDNIAASASVSRRSGSAPESRKEIPAGRVKAHPAGISSTIRGRKRSTSFPGLFI